MGFRPGLETVPVEVLPHRREHQRRVGPEVPAVVERDARPVLVASDQFGPVGTARERGERIKTVCLDLPQVPDRALARVAGGDLVDRRRRVALVAPVQQEIPQFGSRVPDHRGFPVEHPGNFGVVGPREQHVARFEVAVNQHRLPVGRGVFAEPPRDRP